MMANMNKNYPPNLNMLSKSLRTAILSFFFFLLFLCWTWVLFFINIPPHRNSMVSHGVPRYGHMGGKKRFAQSSRQLPRRIQNIATHSIRCNWMDAAAGWEVSITSNIPKTEIRHHILGNTTDNVKRILRFDPAFTYTHPQMVVECVSRLHVVCLYQATVTQKSKYVQPSL